MIKIDREREKANIWTSNSKSITETLLLSSPSSSFGEKKEVVVVVVKKEWKISTGCWDILVHI